VFFHQSRFIILRRIYHITSCTDIPNFLDTLTHLFRVLIESFKWTAILTYTVLFLIS